MRRLLFAAIAGLVLMIPLATGIVFMLPEHTSTNLISLGRPAAPEPEPTPSAVPSATDLSPRVAVVEDQTAELESKLKQQETSLNNTIGQLRFVLGGLTILLTFIVAMQAIFQARQDGVQHKGVQQVADVMTVIKETVQARLDSEQEARQQVKSLTEQIDGLHGDVGKALQLRDNFLTIITSQRAEIEAAAASLAQTSRHGFRILADRLTSFARQLDVFTRQYQPIEEGTQEFSARVKYVRGVAALYDNDPATAATNLRQVITDSRPISGEPQIAHLRRVANAYYYLGLGNASFGRTAEASDDFTEAKRLDPDGNDFLTRVVAAEALAMSGATDNARDEARQVADQIVEWYGSDPDRMPLVQLRLRSRATLIQANIEIIENREGFRQRVRGLLEPVRTDDPNYYYAIMTLAQVNAGQPGVDAEATGDLFRRAYTAIVNSDDLKTVTETRTQVLLHMAAGICCLHGPRDRRLAESYLHKAEQRSRFLPKMDTEECMVFSILSKRDESRATIMDHLERIRAGEVLLPGARMQAPR